MADELKPMSDERLAEIESRIDTLSGFSISEPVESYELYSIGMDLLAEVYRLRAREAAAMEIVQAVATQDTIAHEGDAGDDYRCVFCGSTEFDWRRYEAQDLPIREKIGTEWRFVQHESDCLVTKSRALLEQ